MRLIRHRLISICIYIVLVAAHRCRSLLACRRLLCVGASCESASCVRVSCLSFCSLQLLYNAMLALLLLSYSLNATALGYGFSLQEDCVVLHDARLLTKCIDYWKSVY